MRLTLVVLLAVVALGAVPALPASAEPSVIDDEVGDVWKSPDLFHWSRAEVTRNVDIRTFEVRNGIRQVVLRVEYVNLVANRDQTSLTVWFRSDYARSRVLFAEFDRGYRNGWFDVTTMGTGEIDCIPKGEVNYRADTVRVVIPHACVARGDWLEFDVTTSMGRGQSPIAFSDDPMTSGPNKVGWSDEVRRGRHR